MTPAKYQNLVNALTPKVFALEQMTDQTELVYQLSVIPR